ncbi:hypothetical protein HU200_034515 [Digitaria exilis]|uniref:Terpene synthase n=1 Tax=Digitaria exilis TaxID=1010633 RepID=A0A835BHM3_9POAL|nr:hypothetical protein HU200_034515 [Digitaria exilis]
MSSIHNAEFNSSSLHEVTLRFRLLRQHGFWISADELNKFKNEDGSFLSDIANDPKGLLSLYHAANLLTHNEEPLDEALLFARHHLEVIRCNLKSPLAEQVKRALKIPLPRNIKREEAIYYILEYAQDETYNATIQELAKLEFNRLQRVYLKELKAISLWWKDLSEYVNLGYARDRVVECYFWSYCCLYEEEYARSRIVLAKLLKLTTLLDDTFDEYATLEECRVLSKALERWDERDVSLLPEYLKKFFLRVIENFRDFDDLLEPHEKYRSAYIRSVYKNICKSYLQEAEWSHSGYIPSFHDQVNVSVMSAGGQLVAIGILFGLGDIATNEVFEWAIKKSCTVTACGEVSRFMDDLADFKRGRNKMDVASSVECYMKENNVTSEVALAKVDSLVDHAWKTLNQELFERRDILSIVNQITNFGRSVMFLYHDKRDGYTNSEQVKDALESHYIKPVPM